VLPHTHSGERQIKYKSLGLLVLWMQLSAKRKRCGAGGVGGGGSCRGLELERLISTVKAPIDVRNKHPRKAFKFLYSPR
jgi:hypothetical protein